MLGAKVRRKDNCRLANLDVKNDDCQGLLINTNLSYIGLDFFSYILCGKICLLNGAV